MPGRSRRRRSGKALRTCRSRSSTSRRTRSACFVITETSDARAQPADLPAALASGQDRPGDRGSARTGRAERPADPCSPGSPARAAARQPAAASRQGSTAPDQRDREEHRELFDELTALIQAHAPELLEQRSIGTVTAAVISDRTAGARRFRSGACFARHAGPPRSQPTPAKQSATYHSRTRPHALRPIARIAARP